MQSTGAQVPPPRSSQESSQSISGGPEVRVAYEIAAAVPLAKLPWNVVDTTLRIPVDG